MKKEEKLLIELCRCYVFEKTVGLDKDIDWQRLYHLAVAHNLVAVCHCALSRANNKNIIPNECLSAIRNKFLDAVYLHEKQMNCVDEIKDILTTCNTPYILFKGSRLKSIYPVAESRLMGDIDIVIEPENQSKVKNKLINASYKCVAQNGPVFNYSKDNILIEVHTKLINDYHEKAFSKPFEHASFDGCEGSFDNNFHFAYLIAHTAHHFKFYGAGIKMILDLAVMQKCCDIDFNVVFNYLQEINLEAFGKVILSVCSKWFGIGIRYVNDVAQVEEYLCTSGAFGGENKNKGIAIARKELEKGNSLSPFMLKLRLAFPSYDKLKDIDYIRFINGRPWLTPYAWCYRFFYNIKNRRALMTGALSSLKDEKTKSLANEELRLFEEIGLI